MKDPAILLYTSDFLTETYFLNMEERGQLITIICLQQQHGHLPWALIRKTVGPLSELVYGMLKMDDNGLFYNERTDLEIERRRKYSKRQSENAQKRWTRRPPADPPATAEPD